MRCLKLSRGNISFRRSENILEGTMRVQKVTLRNKLGEIGNLGYRIFGILKLFVANRVFLQN